MSLATRVGLVAEDRLASGALPSPTHPGSLSPGSQAESCAGRASTAMGPLWSGWSVWQRQLAVHPVTAGILCARAGQSRCQVRPGCCCGDRMGLQTARIPTPQPQLCFRLWLVAAGSSQGWEAV